MVQGKATFLSVARELRQNILIQSYQCDTWSTVLDFTEHKDDIKRWAATPESAVAVAAISSKENIESVRSQRHIEIVADKLYAKSKSLEVLKKQQEIFLWSMSDKEARATIWKTTRGESEPRGRVHRKLYLMKQKWWHDMGGRKAWTLKEQRIFASKNCSMNEAGRKDEDASHLVADTRVYVPWDKKARRRDVEGYREYIAHWQEGPSGLAWDRTGSDHSLSTWDRASRGSGRFLSLNEAADQDIAWIEEQAKQFFRDPEKWLG